MSLQETHQLSCSTCALLETTAQLARTAVRDGTPWGVHSSDARFAVRSIQRINVHAAVRGDPVHARPPVVRDALQPGLGSAAPSNSQSWGTRALARQDRSLMFC